MEIEDIFINGKKYDIDSREIMFITSDGYPLFREIDGSWSNEDFGFESSDDGLPYDFYTMNEPVCGKIILRSEYESGS